MHTRALILLCICICAMPFNAARHVHKRLRLSKRSECCYFAVISATLRKRFSLIAPALVFVVCRSGNTLGQLQLSASQTKVLNAFPCDVLVLKTLQFIAFACGYVVAFVGNWFFNCYCCTMAAHHMLGVDCCGQRTHPGWHSGMQDIANCSI